jgi:hypothetical protein
MVLFLSNRRNGRRANADNKDLATDSTQGDETESKKTESER